MFQFTIYLAQFFLHLVERNKLLRFWWDYIWGICQNCEILSMDIYIAVFFSWGKPVKKYTKSIFQDKIIVYTISMHIYGRKNNYSFLTEKVSWNICTTFVKLK